jgi:hypothetical protein
MRLLVPALLLLLPCAAVAQFRPMYTPGPRYTPAPTRPGPTYSQIQAQTQQIGQRSFQRQQAEQQQLARQMMQQNQQRMIMQNQLHAQRMIMMLRVRSQQQVAQDQEKQRQAEQKATEQLAQLAQEQQRRQTAQPQPDEEQALAQKQADARELTRLSVKNYQEVFLPGQVQATLQSMVMSPAAGQRVQRIEQDLRNNAWWRGQNAAQAQQQLVAYSTELATLTSGLLGFDVSSTPAATVPLSMNLIQEQLAKNEFDQAVAGQLLQEAGRAERAATGMDLAQAVVELQKFASAAATSADYQQDPKKLRSEAKARMQRVRQELQRYHARIGSAGKVLEAQNAILKSTAAYLERTGPQK